MAENRNSLHGQKEVRNLELPELRIDMDNGKPKLRGYAAVFNKKSEQLYGPMGFRESIAEGAFTEALKKDDVRGLLNHDANWVLGRNKAGTLTLEEDKKGLAFVIDPPDTQWARDLQVSINRGDINQCSFSFEVAEDEWNDKETERMVKKVARLYDISIVTFPAYPQTSAKVRCAMTEAGLDCKSLGEVLTRRGALTERDNVLIHNAIEALSAYLPKNEPVPPGAPPVGCAAELDILKRQLALIALG